jgi:hypothetical protein
MAMSDRVKPRLDGTLPLPLEEGQDKLLPPYEGGCHCL